MRDLDQRSTLIRVVVSAEGFDRLANSKVKLSADRDGWRKADQAHGMTVDGLVGPGRLRHVVVANRTPHAVSPVRVDGDVPPLGAFLAGCRSLQLRQAEVLAHLDKVHGVRVQAFIIQVRIPVVA